MNKICIYLLTSPSGKIYIGKTSNFEKRMQSYAVQKAIRQPLLNRSILKYGFENFTKDILCECDKMSLNYWEVFYIKLFNSTNKSFGMNLHLGGNGGNVMTKEGRQRMLDMLVQRIGNKNPNFGNHFKHTETARKNMLQNQPSRKGCKNSRAKSVICIETGEVFGTANEAGKKIGVSGSMICRIVKGERKTAKGLHFERTAATDF